MNTLEPNRILLTVARCWDVTVPEITSPSRVRQIADARAVAAWALRIYGPATRDEGMIVEHIAAHLRRDHTTITYSIQKVLRLRQQDTRFHVALERLESELNTLAGMEAGGAGTLITVLPDRATPVAAREMTAGATSSGDESRPTASRAA